MESQQYEVVVPSVSWRMYIPEGTFLLLSFATPIVAWMVSRDGNILGRSGSVMLLFAAVAEFVTMHRTSKKHILNACRAKSGETPWDFSRPAKVVGIVSLIAALVGTVLWGFGDLIFKT